MQNQNDQGSHPFCRLAVAIISNADSVLWSIVNVCEWVHASWWIIPSTEFMVWHDITYRPGLMKYRFIYGTYKPNWPVSLILWCLLSEVRNCHLEGCWRRHYNWSNFVPSEHGPTQRMCWWVDGSWEKSSTKLHLSNLGRLYPTVHASPLWLQCPIIAICF
jgi:hypothetical protein